MLTLWIVSLHKGSRIYQDRSFISLGNEIIAIIRIWISNTKVVFPAHRSTCIEIMLSIHHTLFYFLQVIGLLDIVRIKGLILQITAIAIDFHLIDIGKACSTHHIRSQLMHPRFAHPNLSPFSTSQHRVCCIDGISIITCTTLQASLELGTLQGAGFHVQHEARQNLITIVSEYQRRESNNQQTLLTAFSNLLVDSHLLRERSSREAVIVYNIGSRHIHILRIFHLYRINRVLISSLQGEGIHKLRQHRIYLHFLRGEVKEFLCRSRHCHRHEAQPKSEDFQNLISVHIFLSKDFRSIP